MTVLPYVLLAEGSVLVAGLVLAMMAHSPDSVQSPRSLPPAQTVEGVGNVLLGQGAGGALVAGDHNFAVGPAACENLVRGSRNECYGPHTLVPEPEIDDFVNIGNHECWHRRVEVACPFVTTPGKRP